MLLQGNGSIPNKNPSPNRLAITEDKERAEINTGYTKLPKYILTGY